MLMEATLATSASAKLVGIQINQIDSDFDIKSIQ